MLPSGVDEVVAMLAILHVGASYSPVAVDCPPRRLAYQLSDAGARLLLTTSEHAEQLAGLAVTPLFLDTLGAPTAACPLQVAPEVDGRSLAFVLYTSGSTGEPKGVLLDHAMITNYLAWFVEETDLHAGDRMLHCCAPTFDVAIAELLNPICAGAMVIIASQDDLHAPAALAELVLRERVTHVFSTPTVVGLLPPGDYPDLRMMILAGERADPAVINRWTADPGRRVFNLYGPAESALGCSWFECERGQQYRTEPPIGRMMPNRHCYLLDPAGNLVPSGLPGELVLGGTGVARGYLGRPELTAAVFVPDPFRPDATAYRTGDLARWNRQGQLEFVGRRDGQVKVRGLRIELGEIEQVLRTHPLISNAAVAVRGAGTDEAALVGYLVTTGPLDDPSSLSEYLAEFLPRYMIPASWLVLTELPCTENGKIDRSALPDPVRVAGSAARLPARTATEKAIVGVFTELLSAAEVGADDEFFAIGGNSLQAIRAVSRINEVCDVDLSVREFYNGASVAGLAALIDRRNNQLRSEQERLLSTVESMTDEEVERLLNSE
jgi:amino acid adenylation domain-containing protein